MKTKKCTSCLKIKDIKDFAIDNRNKDGKQSKCRDCVLLYHLNYRKKNKKQISKMKKLYTLKIKRDYPWRNSAKAAKARCNNINTNSYIYYGARGIKYLLSDKQIKELWFKNKAYLMKYPTLDRKNGNKNYTYKNCRFIERALNSKLKGSRQTPPKHIGELLNIIRVIWRNNSKLRLCQLIGNCFEHGDLYYKTDKEIKINLLKTYKKK